MILNVKPVVGTLGALLFFLGVALLLPLGVDLIYREGDWLAFGITALVSMAGGGALWYRWGGKGSELRARDGFAIVAFSWFVLSLLGALPFYLSGTLDSYTDAFFETMSGFTTTGATILGGEHTPAIEELSHALLFWRSLSHWIGGMGIIVLTLAILPILGIGGMQMFKAEVPGPTADKLTPRVRETAQRLWLIYVGITGVQVILLWPAMGLFDAINHAFATMATGGFSTKNGSVGQYASGYVDWVITIFMILAGFNFALHYRLLKGRFESVFKDTELRVYLLILLGATVLMTVSLMGDDESFWMSLRLAAFQAASIVTTTGFGTADYELWPALAMTVIFLLFFAGGMAGSTGGGIKIVRHVLMFKNSFKELKQLIHPRAVLTVRINGQPVADDVMRNVLSFLVLYCGLSGLGTLVMAMTGLDVLSAFTATVSCIGNIGPAFGDFGPAENYASITAFGKWVLSFLMMAGRLEIFTVLILLSPVFWEN
ncbi:MAG: potassium transporter TrkG [Rhodothermales bacterium]